MQSWGQVLLLTPEDDGTIINGHLPKKAARLVSDWCNDHKTALLANWQKAVELQPLERIPGADYD